MTNASRVTLMIYMIMALVVSFWAGTMFQKAHQINTTQKQPARIFIEQQKTQLKITSDDPDVEIYVDGERILTDTP